MSHGAAMDVGARFVEVQRFRSNPIAAGVVVLVVLLCSGSMLDIVLRGPLGHGSWIGLAVFGSVTFLLLAGNLRVEVRSDGIHARLFPLTRQHTFPWSEIKSIEARTYRPILEYGGWGIRWSRHGKAYNVYGNRGVQLEFHDGRRLLLGSQRADELAAAAQEMARQSER